MKVKIFGKVTRRTVHTTPKNEQLYQIEIEEPSMYPSYFQLSSKDASLFGKPDGPFAVGKMVTAYGFLNGSFKDVAGKDGKQFRAYRTWITLTKMESAEAPLANEPAEPSVSEDPEDLPL